MMPTERISDNPDEKLCTNEDHRPQASKKKSIEQRLITVLDWLTGDDFCNDLDMQMESPEAKKKMSKDLTQAAEKLTLIYTLVHGFDKSNSCYEVHGDWRKKFFEIEKGIISEND